MRRFNLIFCILVIYVKISTMQNAPGSMGNTADDGFQSQLTPHIIKGMDAKIRQFKYQISIFKRKKNNKFMHTCGGSIVSKKFILSAAHCFHDKDLTKYFVKTGIILITKSLHDYKIEEVCILKTYNIKNQLIDDIAILKTTSVIKYNTNIGPIPIQMDPIPDGEIATVSGWGRINPSKKVSPERLQYLDVKIMNYETCRKFPAFTGILDPNMHLCTEKTTGSGFCHGDSGGPLAYKNSLIGIVSFAEGCANKGPDVYTKPRTYVKWILENMQQMGAREDDYPKFVKINGQTISRDKI